MGNGQGEKEKEVSRQRIKEMIAEYAEGSQQEFANATGIQKANVSHYVNGTHAPGNIVAAKIAKRYSLNPLWVMGFDVPKKIKTDAQKFGEWAEAFNETHSPIMLSDGETDLIRKYRMLDDHGADIVDTVLEKEYARCVDERENSVVIDREYLKSLPMEERLKFLGDEKVVELKRVARRRK